MINVGCVGVCVYKSRSRDNVAGDIVFSFGYDFMCRDNGTAKPIRPGDFSYQPWLDHRRLNRESAQIGTNFFAFVPACRDNLINAKWGGLIPRSRARWKITPELGSYAGRNSGPLYELTYTVAPHVATRREGTRMHPAHMSLLNPPGA